MFNFDQPLCDLVTAIKERLSLWDDHQEELLQYRFGFYRLPFYKDRLEDGLALHIWLEYLPQDNYPHTHIFDLTSRVLKGSLENNNWRVTETEKGDYRLIDAICNETKCTDFDTGRFCDLQKICQEQIDVGGIYSVAKSIFHTTKILAYPTVTFIKRGCVEPSIYSSHLIPRNSLERVRDFNFKVVDHKVAWAQIRSILSTL